VLWGVEWLLRMMIRSCFTHAYGHPSTKRLRQNARVRFLSGRSVSNASGRIPHAVLVISM
jgi:hypothetical protein